MLVLAYTNTSGQCNVSLGGYSCSPIYQFTTQSQMLAGATASNCVNLSFNLSNSNCSGWTLKVRTGTSTFANGSSTVPVQYVSIKFNSTSGGPNVNQLNYTTNAIALSTSEQVLVSNSSSNLKSPPYYYFVHKFDAIIQGGTHLYQPTNGTFSTTLIFTLYNSSGQLVSTTSMPFNFQIQYQGPNLFDNCQGISLNGNVTSPIATFNTYSQLMNGITTNNAVSVAYGLINNSTNCPGWSLKVRAVSANFSNNGNNIPVNKVSLRFNSVNGGPSANDIGVSYNPIPLSTSEQALIANSNARFVAPPHGNVTHTFDAIVEGGAHMLQPSNGTFSVGLVFTLYDWNNQLVATWNTTANIQINFNSNSIFSMALQNGGDDASFNFSTVADMQNGIILNKPNSLKITAYQNYQVFVQTTNADLVSANTSYTLPVSVINLEVSLGSPISGVTTNTVSLSQNNQLVITNTNTNWPNQTVEYNLKYFINGNQPSFFSVPADSYTGTLLYVVVPY